MKRILLYAFLILLIISCKDKKEYNELTDLNKVEVISSSYTVLNDTSIFNFCFDFDIYKDYLLVLSYVDEKFVHIYDKNSGKHIKSILAQGRGPGEIPRCRKISTNIITGKVSWYEFNESKYFSFNIDSIINNEQYVRYIETSYPNYRAFEIFEGNDQIIGLGEFYDKKMTRLGLVNSDSVVFRYDYCPELPELELENIQAALRLNTCWHFSTLNNKLVCGSSNGSVLEIFDIDKTSIKISSLKVFEKPAYSMDNKNIPENAEGKFTYGFSGVYVTSKNIYASYIGGSDFRNNNDKIVEFDLDGNPLRILKFDNISIRGICVDESNEKNRIYMMVEKEDQDNFIIYADI